MLARVEAIITELVFEHALRMRMKAEVTDSAPQSNATTAAATPDSASVAESSTTAQNEGSADSEATSSAGKGKQKISEQATDASRVIGKEAESKPQEDKAKNVAGKINNLISSDLASIGQGRESLELGTWDLSPWDTY